MLDTMASSLCRPDTWASLILPNIEIQNIYVDLVTDYPVSDSVQVPNHGFNTVTDINFCNVTIKYTHHEEDDYPIVTEIWLPQHDSWNERFLAIGGGGFAAGRAGNTAGILSGAVSEQYATITTDGGVVDGSSPQFFLTDTGDFDEIATRNWASESLRDMATIGKNVVALYYGRQALYSYYSGCSNGGRQGYELAQRFPDAFDGIAASAPVIRAVEALYLFFWPQYIMYQAASWPRECELDSLTALALEKCDADDGFEDGIVGDPWTCDLDPFTFVGSRAVSCRSDDSTISEMAAVVANATWGGVLGQDGSLIYPGLYPGTDITGDLTGGSIAGTTCQDEGEECGGRPIDLGYKAVQVFSLRDKDGDYTQVSPEEFYGGLEEANQALGKYLNSTDANLAEFRDRGGKLISFHGLGDRLFSSSALREYYDKVSEKDPAVADFYRFFEIPGLGHCKGPQHPDSTFNALKAWVEDGVAPEHLAYKQPDADGNQKERIACPYPRKLTYKSLCGDPSSAKCYNCE